MKLQEAIGRKKGSNLTLLTTSYTKPRKDYNTDKWLPDVMTVVYRDNETGDKSKVQYTNPEYEFYWDASNKVIDYNRLFIDKNEVEIISVPFTKLEKTLADKTNNLNFYYDNLKNGNKYANRLLHTHNKVFNSDMNINDQIRYQFSKLYTNETYEISKGFLDIETDIINAPMNYSIDETLGWFKINVSSYIDMRTETVYTFCLRDGERPNPQIEKFEEYVNTGAFQTELKEFVQKRVKGWKNEIRYKLNNYQYKVLFFDEEIEMIQTIFQVINTLQPDFVLAWNMGFDIPYIIERIKTLGYDPAEIMCHPDFVHKECFYYKDVRAQIAEEKGDFCTISSYTVYLDQLIQFASRRKGQSKLPNNKLDTVTKVFTGMGKLEWDNEALFFGERVYQDYKKFVMYNIVDTICQQCIEVKIDDIGYVFNKSLMNNTRYEKVHRQTVYLVNRGTKSFWDEGLIISNNCNKFNDKPDKKFPGALVGDPVHIVKDVFIKENGIPTMLFNNGDDFDYTSLYPSINHEFNIAPNTQIGKLLISEVIFKGENPFKDEKFDRGGMFMEDFQSHNYIEFLHRWFNMGTFTEIYEDVIEYYTKIKAPSGWVTRYMDDDGLVNVFDEINPNAEITIMEEITEANKLEKAMFVCKPFNEAKKIVEDVVYEDYFYKTPKDNF